MNLAIMQPYFFPYPGYFQLMAQADTWVVFDHCQFVNKGWVNRNRVLHPNPDKGWQFLTVPLSNRGRFDFIDEIEIDERNDWSQSLAGRLSHYRRAPNYQRTMALFTEALGEQSTALSDLLIRSLRLLAAHLGIRTEILVYSELNLGIDQVAHPGEWALKISQALGATEYTNPVSGRALFDPEQFRSAGIDLRFLETNIRQYQQGGYGYVPNLSILDTLMWCDPETLRAILNEDFILHSGQSVIDE